MNDLISRQAVLDAITASVNQFGGRYTTDMINMWGLFTQMIQQMPTAQPERKTGRWLRSGSDLFPFECDQCAETNERTTPWCPHCGCMMEVEHE